MKKLIPLLIMIACTTVKYTTTIQDSFFNAIKEHCGKAYEGKVVTDIPKGSGFDQRLVMHVRECSDSELKIPFFVGEDRSRTWIITKTDQGLRLKHDHRNKDGSPDKSTMYGGDTADHGTPNLQAFPADQYSKDMFVEQGIPQSVYNVWKVYINDKTFSYQLTRTNSDRNFKVDFDLSKPITPPPAPWGH